MARRIFELVRAYNISDKKISLTMMSAKQIALFLAAIAVLAVDYSPALAGAKITIPETNYTFGKILQHSVLTKRFWIKSVGDKPARITEALQDCSCTDLLIKDSTIAPGDSVPLDVTLHSRSFIGFINKRSHYLIAGSPDTAYLMMYAEVLVKADNEKPLVLAPDRVDVSQFGAKPRRRGVFTLTNNSAQDYEISVVDSSAKSFDVTIPKVIKAGQKIDGTVVVKKNRIATSFEESFTIEITDDGRSRYSVPVARLYQPAESAGAAPR